MVVIVFIAGPTGFALTTRSRFTQPSLKKRSWSLEKVSTFSTKLFVMVRFYVPEKKRQKGSEKN